MVKGHLRSFRLALRDGTNSHISLKEDVILLGLTAIGTPTTSISNQNTLCAVLVSCGNGYRLDVIRGCTEVFVNGESPNPRRPLEHGDVIRLPGGSQLSYRETGMAEVESENELALRAEQLFRGTLEPQDVISTELLKLLQVLAGQQSSTDGFAIAANIDVPELDGHAMPASP